MVICLCPFINSSFVIIFLQVLETIDVSQESPCMSECIPVDEVCELMWKIIFSRMLIKYRL